MPKYFTTIFVLIFGIIGLPLQAQVSGIERREGFGGSESEAKLRLFVGDSRQREYGGYGGPQGGAHQLSHVK